jgi:hypothetical protein
MRHKKKYPQRVEDAGLSAMETYDRALQYGERWAEMCALQEPPGTKGSDRAYMEGRMNNQQLDGMPERQAKWLAREAREAGISIEGKYYCGGLADGRRWRDPEAWVSGVDDVLRVAKKRNRAVAGAVNYEPAPAPPKRTLLNESIIKEEVRREQRRNPRAKAGEVREKLLANHAYRVKNR